MGLKKALTEEFGRAWWHKLLFAVLFFLFAPGLYQWLNGVDKGLVGLPGIVALPYRFFGKIGAVLICAVLPGVVFVVIGLRQRSALKQGRGPLLMAREGADEIPKLLEAHAIHARLHGEIEGHKGLICDRQGAVCSILVSPESEADGEGPEVVSVLVRAPDLLTFSRYSKRKEDGQLRDDIIGILKGSPLALP
jgi:hypothetical protein